MKSSAVQQFQIPGDIDLGWKSRQLDKIRAAKVFAAIVRRIEERFR